VLGYLKALAVASRGKLLRIKENNRCVELGKQETTLIKKYDVNEPCNLIFSENFKRRQFSEGLIPGSDC
jgi:hypothetical protein